MYREHSKVFLPPDDNNAQIWQFMDFPEFVSVLDQRSLLFSKAIDLFDPYEGKLPQGNKSAKIQYDNKSDNLLLPSILREKIRNTLRNIIVINSWHINEFESALEVPNLCMLYLYEYQQQKCCFITYRSDSNQFCCNTPGTGRDRTGR